jgi:hypothetical protein
MKTPFEIVADEMENEYKTGRRGIALNVPDLVFALRQISMIARERIHESMDKAFRPGDGDTKITFVDKDLEAPLMTIGTNPVPRKFEKDGISTTPLWKRFSNWYDAAASEGSLAKGDLPLMQEVLQYLKSHENVKNE